MVSKIPPQGHARNPAHQDAALHSTAASAPDRATETVTGLHKKIGTILVEIDRWESRNGPYDQRKDDMRLDIKLKSLIAELCGTPARSEGEVMNKLERAIHVGGRGTPTGDKLIEGALHDLRRIRVVASQ